jgi:hypothetical protein
VVEDISHEGLRVLLAEQGVSFQRLKTFKQSRDPDYERKKNRILHLYGLMDGVADVAEGDPDVVICVDEFGPLNLQPTQDANGPTAAVVGHTHTAAGGRSTPDHMVCGTCSPPTTCPAIGCMGTSNPGSAVGVPDVPAVCAHDVPACGPDHDRAGQLQPAPVDQRR